MQVISSRSGLSPPTVAHAGPEGVGGGSGISGKAWRASGRPGFPQAAAGGGKVWRRPAPRVIPMGWTDAVVVAQALQDAFTRLAALPEHQRFHPDRPVALWIPVWGSIIDDCWAFGGRGDVATIRSWFSAYDASAKHVGIIMSDPKSVDGEDGGEVQSLLLKSDRTSRTWLRLSPVERARLSLGFWGILGTPAPPVRGMQRTVGKS